MVNNINNKAAIERLGHIITNTKDDIDNANHNNPLILSNNDANDLKSSFEEFSKNFVGYRGPKSNRNVPTLGNGGLPNDDDIYQLDNKIRHGNTDNMLNSISEGKLSILTLIYSIYALIQDVNNNFFFDNQCIINL